MEKSVVQIYLFVYKKSINKFQPMLYSFFLWILFSLLIYIGV